MPEHAPTPKLTRGVVWREFSTGQSSVGSPLGEKAYIMPGFPVGITASELPRESDQVQRQTVIAWFLSNCRPHDPADPPTLGGIPQGVAPMTSHPTGGGFGSGGFGSGGFGGDAGRGGFGTGGLEDESPRPLLAVPGPFAAIYPMTLEFEGVIADDHLSNISNEFPGEWVWIPPQGPSEALWVAEPSDPFLRADLGARLAAIEAALHDLRPAFGGLGHNSLGEDPPISGTEEDALLRDLQAMRSDVTAAPLDHLAGLWARIAPSLKRFAAWCGARATFFIDEGFSKGGAKWLFVLAALMLADSIPAVEKLLSALSKLH
jgi:hypothetical protein